MKFKGILLCLGLISFSTFAAEQVIREEITPPAPDGALTIEQIPPVSSINKALPTNMAATPAVEGSKSIAPSITPPPVQPMQNR